MKPNTNIHCGQCDLDLLNHWVDRQRYPTYYGSKLNLLTVVKVSHL